MSQKALKNMLVQKQKTKKTTAFDDSEEIWGKIPIKKQKTESSLYFLIGKGVVSEKSIKTIEYEKAHRMGCIQGKSHKSHNWPVLGIGGV